MTNSRVGLDAELLYEVVSPFISCSGLHGPHRSLEEAKQCFDQIGQQEDGIAVNPATGKCIHAIVALAADGTQRKFSDKELDLVDTLSIDRRIILEDVPNVTTFAHIAGLSYAALLTTPHLSVDLAGFFDYKSRNKHYWSSEEGLGQSLAYVQQAFFTLELCLKALLETTGQLVKMPKERWKQHEPAILFRLLNRETRQILEQRWSQERGPVGHLDSTFQEFLGSINEMYTAWRYIPERKDSNLTADLRPIVSACGIVLDTSRFMFRRDYPVKPRITTEIISSGRGQDQSQEFMPIIFSGRVTSVKVPEGVDPHSIVEVAIETEEYGLLTLEVLKRNPEQYHGLAGNKITVGGYYNPDCPAVVRSSNILAIDDNEGRDTRYSVETRVLHGTIFDVSRPKGPDRQDMVALLLKEETYFTMVQCLFLTREEQSQITGASDSGEQLQLGDRISVRGQVTLKNGLPVVLLGPDSINKLAPREDQ